MRQPPEPPASVPRRDPAPGPRGTGSPDAEDRSDPPEYPGAPAPVPPSYPSPPKPTPTPKPTTALPAPSGVPADSAVEPGIGRVGRVRIRSRQRRPDAAALGRLAVQQPCPYPQVLAACDTARFRQGAEQRGRGIEFRGGQGPGQHAKSTGTFDVGEVGEGHAWLPDGRAVAGQDGEQQCVQGAGQCGQSHAAQHLSRCGQLPGRPPTAHEQARVAAGGEPERRHENGGLAVGPADFGPEVVEEPLRGPVVGLPLSWRPRAGRRHGRTSLSVPAPGPEGMAFLSSAGRPAAGEGGTGAVVAEEGTVGTVAVGGAAGEDCASTRLMVSTT